MSHDLFFYPVGNGDTSQIVLANGKRILLDFYHQAQAEDPGTPHVDLQARLKKELKDAGRDYFDVVAFTHLDKDHIHGCSDFFEFLHAKKYQGEDRVKIKVLWVPAAVILEEGSDSEDRILRQEARHRLIEGKDNIRVFSFPDPLIKWLKDKGVEPETRRHLITHAGKIAPDFSIETDGVEFFCHSPFAEHCNDGDISRNSASLIFQVRFNVGGVYTNFLAIGDTEHTDLAAVVRTSTYYGHLSRLDWDVFNIPHHCSYRALSNEKGESVTTPDPDVEKLLLRGQEGAYLISSSHPIDNDADAYSRGLPPHVQAKNCYIKYLKMASGRDFLVTMEQPSREEPKPIQITIGMDGPTWYRSAVVSGSATILTQAAPRAGTFPHD